MRKSTSLTRLRRQVQDLKRELREAKERTALKATKRAIKKQRGRKGLFADFVRREFAKHPGINLKKAAQLAKKAYREV